MRVNIRGPMAMVLIATFIALGPYGCSHNISNAKHEFTFNPHKEIALVVGRVELTSSKSSHDNQFSPSDLTLTFEKVGGDQPFTHTLGETGYFFLPLEPGKYCISRWSSYERWADERRECYGEYAGPLNASCEVLPRKVTYIGTLRICLEGEEAKLQVEDHSSTVETALHFLYPKLQAKMETHLLTLNYASQPAMVSRVFSPRYQRTPSFSIFGERSRVSPGGIGISINIGGGGGMKLKDFINTIRQGE